MTPVAPYLLYLVFALGGAGLYLLLPKSNRSSVMPGAVLGVLALIGLIVVLAARVVVADTQSLYFYLFSLIAIVAATRVVTHPRPVYSALYFVLVVIAVAALLVLQGAEFLAIALITIYAGAILVTYLFVIMLAQQSGSPLYDRNAREPFLAVLAGFVLMAAIAGQAGALPQPTETPVIEAQSTVETPSATAPLGHTAEVGLLIMTQYIVALEIAGVLLLVSMIGAIALSRKKVPVPERGRSKPLGQLGREVGPY
jgi:NADH-quinone oxidoreductase subunit J